MSRHLSERVRIPCLVPFCNRTVPLEILDTPIGGMAPNEALCTKHWRMVPRKWRRVHERATEHLLVAPTDKAFARAALIWRRIKARALSAAVARMAVALLAILLAGPVACTTAPQPAMHQVAAGDAGLVAIEAEYEAASRDVAAYLASGRTVPERVGLMGAMVSAAKGAVDQARRAVTEGDASATFAIGVAQLAVRQLALYVRSASAGAWA